MELIITSDKVQYLKRITDKFLNEEFKDIKISKLDGIYLSCLNDNDGISLIELTNLVHFDKANTTRVINSLEKKELVIKKVDEKDYRKYKIYLTKKGKDLYNYIIDCKKKLNEIAFKDVSEEEKEIFSRVTKKIFQNFDEQL